MKIILAKGGVKREIEGGFAICGSRADLEQVARQILDAIERGFGYGWIDITEAPERHVTANMSPRPWEE